MTLSSFRRALAEPDPAFWPFWVLLVVIAYYAAVSAGLL